MHADKIGEWVRVTLESAKPFPEIVAGLVASGVEYYYVDYVTRSFRFYSAAGAMVEASLSYEQLPEISDAFDAAALKAAILDSQQRGQKYRDFCRRAMQAGVQGYFAFLRGQRVTYLGRDGNHHTEWFPGAQRRDS